MGLDLRGRRVLVTGAASGIGRALAIEFARERADLFLTSHPSELDALDALAERLRREDVEVVVHTVDLRERGAAESIHGAASERDVDVLVNNAGLLSYGPFHELDADAQIQMVHVNVEALVRLTRVFAPDMVERGEGWILNLSSVSAFQATPYHAVYAATKAFVQSFSEAIHAELAPHGVRVCTLNPPYTRTPMIDVIPPVPWNRFVPTMEPEDVARSGIKALKRGRLYHVPDLRSRVANAYLSRLTPRRLTAWFGRNLLRPED